ncbi:MAG TPA: hypothetical protein VME23_12185 [Terracidiphilus sp.]|nr:hypothetical protein [Terracidiphilus sp.]
MGLAEILVSIDREITTLQKARSLIAAKAGKERKNRRPTRLAALNAPTVKPAKRRKKRNLTPEGRQRIADAQRRRWEKNRKAAAAAE